MSVLGGTHYNWSMKGMSLLTECSERLQWCELFTQSGKQQYTDEMHLLKHFKQAIADKNREKSKEIPQSFTEASLILLEDFEENALNLKHLIIETNSSIWHTF